MSNIWVDGVFVGIGVVRSQVQFRGEFICRFHEPHVVPPVYAGRVLVPDIYISLAGPH